MTLDYANHSVWLSSSPTKPGDQTSASTWDKYTSPDESSFFYIGGGESISYSNSYNATLVGIYGKKTSDAYFLDSGSGSVSTIDVSATRVQPTSPDDTGCANCSNAKFNTLLRMMKSNTQLTNGAYILRVYNYAQKPTQAGRFFDFPVYLDSFSVTTNMSDPNIMNVSLRFVRRSPVKGINLGTTS